MSNTLHLINDPDPTKGGAQRIVQLLISIERNLVYPYKVRNSLIAVGRVFHLIFYIYSRDINSVVLHSRVYYPLTPLFRLLKLEVIFYCHASYRNKMYLFKLFTPHRYIAVSQSVKNNLLSSNVKSKIEVICNPFLYTVDSSIPKVMACSGSVISLTYIGSLQPWKGVGLLVEHIMASELKQKLSLSVIGDGPMMTDLKSASRDINISFLGYKSSPFLEVTDSHILVIPSLEEGFGMVAIEGIVNYKIIIYSNIPALDEILNADALAVPFVVGDQVSFDSAIKEATRLLGKENLEHLLMKRKKLILEKYNISSFIERIKSIIQ